VAGREKDVWKEEEEEHGEVEMEEGEGDAVLPHFGFDLAAFRLGWERGAA